MSSSEDERPSILPDTLTDARHSDSTFSGLRQRRRAKPKDETPLVETLKKLDFHPKVEKGTKRRASSGGFISILGYVFILILLFSETSDYLTSEIDSKLVFFYYYYYFYFFIYCFIYFIYLFLLFYLFIYLF